MPKDGGLRSIVNVWDIKVTSLSYLSLGADFCTAISYHNYDERTTKELWDVLDTIVTK